MYILKAQSWLRYICIFFFTADYHNDGGDTTVVTTSAPQPAMPMVINTSNTVAAPAAQPQPGY